MIRKHASVLVEVLVLTLIAVVLGLSVHTFRSSDKKIEWIKNYPDPTTPPPIQKESAPVDQGGQKTIAPASEPSHGPISEEKKTGAPAEPPPATKTAVVSSPPPRPEAAKEAIREITVEEAILEHKNNTPFLDARRTKDYDKGHIPGAISMSVWEPNLDARISELLSKIDPGMTVVVYCTGGECTDSHNLATSLEGAGYKDLRIMKGGVPDWVKLGGPAAEKTAGADSSEEGE
jgi:rhodanese-related sulfurtransferase